MREILIYIIYCSSLLNFAVLLDVQLDYDRNLITVFPSTKFLFATACSPVVVARQMKSLRSTNTSLLRLMRNGWARI